MAAYYTQSDSPSNVQAFLKFGSNKYYVPQRVPSLQCTSPSMFRCTPNSSLGVAITSRLSVRSLQAYLELGGLGERVLGFCDFLLPADQFPKVSVSSKYSLAVDYSPC